MSCSCLSGYKPRATTRTTYDVVVCGPRPYTGDLLIGGSARLARILPDPVVPASPPQVQRIPDLVFSFGGVINVGAVQLVHISLPDVSTRPATPSGQSPGILPGGSDERSSESRPGRCSKAGQDPGAGGTGHMPARHGR